MSEKQNQVRGELGGDGQKPLPMGSDRTIRGQWYLSFTQGGGPAQRESFWPKKRSTGSNRKRRKCFPPPAESWGVPQDAPLGTSDIMVLSSHGARRLGPSQGYLLLSGTCEPLAWYDFVSRGFKCLNILSNPTRLTHLTWCCPEEHPSQDQQ